MKKLFLIVAMAFASLSFIRANVEKKLDKMILEQNIQVSNKTQQNIDTLEQLIDNLRSDTVTIDDLHPMQPGSNWFKNNWEWLLTLLIFLLEVFLRVAPTNKDWSLVNKILSILIWIFRIIPNNAKARENVLKRGHDLRIKKLIEDYRNK